MISASMKAPQLDKSTSRDQLLKAAGALMAERGTIDVSLSAIARKSGLNSALVGYYFGSKNGLLLSLVKDVLGKGLRQLDGLLKMDLDPIDKLKLHVKAIINVYFRYPYINRLIHHMLEDRELGREVAETISKPLADAQCRLLQEGVASGHFKPIDAMMFFELGWSGQSDTTRFHGLSGGKISSAETMASASGVLNRIGLSNFGILAALMRCRRAGSPPTLTPAPGAAGFSGMGVMSRSTLRSPMVPWTR